MQTTCSAVRRDGAPCTAPVLAGGYCFAHDPALAEKRAAARLAGGKGKANTARAHKRLPADLRGVLGRLLGALAEVASCKADPVYFVDTYCKVQSDEGKGLVPFRLFDYQRTVLRAFEEHPEVIVLKARQLGISELAAAYAVYYVNFRPLNTVIVL